MPTTVQLRNRLVSKLKELFQLDQPDLDFGFYRIMHAKADQVTEFLEKDLLKIVEEAFGQAGDDKKAELQAAYDNVIEQAKKYGAPNPEETDAAKEAKAALDALNDTVDAEGDVYDHLYRFFERYYHEGDFISRRYFARETSAKAAPFAIPYNGEEVKLHWTNADQYYIKTAEYFSNYTFDLKQAKEVKEAESSLKFGDEETPLKVHFRIVEASEGEHGNVKASEETKRFFTIHHEKPIELNENKELVINFQYRPDPEKSGQDATWRERRNAESVEKIFATIGELDGVGEYKQLLKIPSPTDKHKDRTLLAKYINQYTARNTYDYFIHKDLGGFLRRELDFYIKNEIMHLDDINNADVPVVETYLSKLKVLRSIAMKVIDFLTQLEEFQKKLWIKKKFVIETNYCITLDRIPEELYEEIAANDAQREDWVKLFAIDEIKGDMHSPAYSSPLTIDFLRANPFLVLDTKFLSDTSKFKLLALIESIDEQSDGLLIHSENYSALNVIRNRFKQQVKSIYNDPPYNTGDDGFAYKDNYKSSSWLSMFEQTNSVIPHFIEETGSYFVSCDENEALDLGQLLIQDFGYKNHVETITWNKRVPKNDKGIGNIHEYVYLFAKNLSLRRSLDMMSRFSENPQLVSK